MTDKVNYRVASLKKYDNIQFKDMNTDSGTKKRNWFQVGFIFRYFSRAQKENEVLLNKDDNIHK